MLIQWGNFTGNKVKKQTWADKTDLERRYSKHDMNEDSDEENQSTSAKKTRPLTTATGREDEHSANPAKRKEKQRPQTTAGQPQKPAKKASGMIIYFIYLNIDPG